MCVAPADGERRFSCFYFPSALFFGLVWRGLARLMVPPSVTRSFPLIMTLVTLRSVPHEASEQEHATFKEGHESMKQGFGATFAQLAAYLARVQ